MRKTGMHGRVWAYRPTAYDPGTGWTNCEDCDACRSVKYTKVFGETAKDRPQQGHLLATRQVQKHKEIPKREEFMKIIQHFYHKPFLVDNNRQSPLDFRVKWQWQQSEDHQEDIPTT